MSQSRRLGRDEAARVHHNQLSIALSMTAEGDQLPGNNLLRQLYNSLGIAGAMMVSLALPSAIAHLFYGGQEMFFG
jgi:hypothetical protein